MNSLAILGILRQAYGEGDQSNQFMDQYLWQGVRGVMSYDRKPTGDDAFVFWQSMALYRDARLTPKKRPKKVSAGYNSGTTSFMDALPPAGQPSPLLYEISQEFLRYSPVTAAIGRAVHCSARWYACRPRLPQ
jgi:hypothetical protein